MTRRTEKAAQAIKEIVSTTVLLGLRDPRIKNVTVLRAEVSPDLRRVDIFVSVMGEDNVRALSLHGLNSARGFLQSKIADRIQTKNTPIITFKMEDAGTSVAMEAARILAELEAERPDKSSPAQEDDFEIDEYAEDESDVELEDIDTADDVQGEPIDHSNATEEVEDSNEDEESTKQLGQNP
jgi:ribosome-binding factor A